MDTETIRGFEMNGSPAGDIKVITDDDFECPFCHRSIETQPLAYIRFAGDNIQIFLKCKCQQSFIGYAIRDSTGYYRIRRLSKGKHKIKVFEKEIQELSPTFVLTYGESEFAEQENLKQICGAGYRRAFEFLIKDYLIKNNPEDKANIEKKQLGNCIKEDIDSTKIKQIAEKAAWLGNDETHYVRKWEDKDLEDLKNLINITVHFVLMEIQANSYIEAMKSKQSLPT
ncbi:MAG: hypothetical protein AABX33_04540 [Nanoarchaeota archaeon]